MLLKNAITYSGTNLIAQVANFISGFVLRRLLIPELMGIWDMTLVVRSYVQTISLGALSGAARELPILRGRDDSAEEFRCRSVALTYSLAEIALLGLCVWGYAFWRKESISTLEFYALLATGLIMLPLRLQEAYVPFFQGAQFYVPLSRVLLINTLVHATLLPTGAILAGIPGLLVAAFVAALFRGTWMAVGGHHAGLKLRLLWDLQVWKRLVSYGLVYRLADYPNTFFMTFDLLWVTKLVGLKGLGLYTLAKSFYTQASEITVRFGTVLYTRLLTQYGQGVDRHKIAIDIRRFMQFQLLVSVPLVCWLVASAAPFLIRQIIPAYAESIPVMMILLLGSFFITQNNNLFTMWIAEKRLLPYGLSNLVGVMTVSGCVASGWFLINHMRLEDVAIAAVLGYAAYFAYMVFTAGRELWGWKIASLIFLQVVAAAVWMAGILALFGGANAPDAGWQEDLVHSALTAMQMLLGILPIVVFGLWVSGGGAYLYRMATDSLRLRFQGV